MAAGSDNHEPLVAELEASSVLVPMLIWHGLPRELLGGEMVVQIGARVAAEPVFHAVGDKGVRQHMFQAHARHGARCERPPFDNYWRLRQHRLHTQRAQPATVERTAEWREAAVRIA